MAPSRFLTIISISLLAAALLISRPLLAASLTSVSDQMTDQSVSSVSNHEITFTTPTGAAEGTTITVTFESGFNLGNLVMDDDVDFEVGGTDRTTADNCTGTEQVSLSLLANVLTATICSGDGGAVSAGSTVVIKIGTNAAGSGAGTNRIINPTAAGTYAVGISGSFGDTGSIYVSIVAGSGGSLSAIVPSTGGGSGSGGGGVEEETAVGEEEEAAEGGEVEEVKETEEGEEGAGEEAEESEEVGEEGVEEGGEEKTEEEITEGEEETGAEETAEGIEEAAPGEEGETAAEAGGLVGEESGEGVGIGEAGGEEVEEVESGGKVGQGEVGVISGYIFEKEDGEQKPVSGAVVELYRSEFGLWVKVDETSVGDNGAFSFSVESGLYRVEVVKEGYGETISDGFTVEGGAAAITRLRLYPIPEGLKEIILSDRAPLEKALAVAGSIFDQARLLLSQFRQSPNVQQVADLGVVALIGITASSAAVLWNVFHLRPFLQYIFTSLAMLIGRKKRKAWGVVYHAGTKLPIDLVIVRLFRLPENHLIATRVTDRAGRYFFLAEPGAYRLEAVKTPWLFPSALLSDVKEDGKYFDVYHGEEIQVAEHEATIAANVPLDPPESAILKEPTRLIRLRFWRRLQQSFAWLGILLAVFVFIVDPGLVTIFGCLVQVSFYLFTRRLARGRKPKSWGIVYDAASRHPISGAIVRIFETKYNKLLETTLTDRRGRYGLLVGPNEYSVTYDKEAYRTHEIRPIDYRQEKEPKEIARDVGLTPVL